MSATSDIQAPEPGGPQPNVERQVADMRRLLSLMVAPSASQALSALRAAFPDAPLAARTAIIGEMRP